MAAHRRPADLSWRLSQYTEHASDFAHYPGVGTHSAGEISYLTIALVGEAGELANDLKKALRDEKLGDESRCLTPERRDNMLGELGDVLWYASQLAGALGSSLDEVAKTNVAKLEFRYNEKADAGDPTAIGICKRRYLRRKSERG